MKFLVYHRSSFRRTVGESSISERITGGKSRRRWQCVLCGAEWWGKTDRTPQRCPKCLRKRWKDGVRHTCLRCGYEWISSMRSPDRCPKCQSKKWNDDGSGKPRQSGLPTDRKVAVFLRYNDGYGCLEISRELGISFDSVYAAVKEAFPDSEPRI